ncbi:MAG: hypothetical protein IJO77_06215, partial [Oscillospiraceae bacterium]|nr:hypothetical protein [Oscillospiraceae bacterium]
MNLTRCSQGHFYDADTNATCPHCSQGSGMQETVAVMRNEVDDSVTVPLTAAAPKTEPAPAAP